MEFKIVEYSYPNILDKNKKDKTKFKNETSDSNIIYFFYQNDECKYIGESSKSLYERCFINTPKHQSRDFFKVCNKIYIIVLDKKIGGFERKAIEGMFILAFKYAGHQLENKEP